MSPSSPPVLPPIEYLLTHLRGAGFAVGIDDFLRVETLLSRIDHRSLLEGVPDERRREALEDSYRALLRPLLVTSREQQSEFDRIFAAFCRLDPEGFREGSRAQPRTLDLPPAPAESSLPSPEEVTRRLEDLAAKRAEEAQAKADALAAAAKQAELERKQQRRRRLLIGALSPLALLVAAGAGALHWARVDYQWSNPAGLDWQLAPADAPDALPQIALTARGGHPLPGLGWLSPTPHVEPGAGTEAGVFRTEPTAQSAGPAAPGLGVRFTAPDGRERSYSARLSLKRHNPFDHVPSAPLLLNARVAQPPPQFQIDPPSAELGPANPLVARFCLTCDQAGSLLSFQPKGVPRLEGDTDRFDLVPEDGFLRPGQRHYFRARFKKKAGKPQYSATILYPASEGQAGAETKNDPAPTSASVIGRQFPPNGVEPREVDAVATVRGSVPQKRAPLPWRSVAEAVGAAALLLLLGLWRGSRTRPREREKQPPALWPLSTGRANRPFSGPRLAETAGLLAPTVRDAELRGALDARATVQATAKRAGFFHPVWESARREPHAYLALIQRANFEDQRAAYFHALVEALRRRGVPIRVYFFAGDPETLLDERTAEPVSLQRLRALYPEERVLLFGESSLLLERGGRSLNSAARVLRSWPEWAVFHIESEDRPSRASAVLATVLERGRFGVFPATLEGLRRFARPVAPGPGATPPAPTPPAPPDPTPETMAGYPAELARYLSDDPRLLLWLAACTLYPHLSYDLTVLIGLRVERLRPEGPGPLVTERNLLRLLRLGWFRAGRMSDQLRLTLQRSLAEAPDIEEEIRAYLVLLLGRPPLPAETTLASDRFTLERSLQERLREDPKRATHLRAALRGLPLGVIYTHPLLPRLLRDPEFELWPDLPRVPRWLMRRLFVHGINRPDHLRFGTAGAAVIVTAAAVVVLLVGKPLGPLRPVPNWRLPMQVKWEPTAVEFSRSGENVKHELSLRARWKTDASGIAGDILRLQARLDEPGSKSSAGSTSSGQLRSTEVRSDAEKPATLDVPPSTPPMHADLQRVDSSGKVIESVSLPAVPLRIDSKQPVITPPAQTLALTSLRAVTAQFHLTGSDLPSASVVLQNLSPDFGGSSDKCWRYRVAGSAPSSRMIYITYLPARHDLLGATHTFQLTYSGPGEDPSARNATAVMTVTFEDPIEAQRKKLRDPSHRVRIAAADSLAQFGARASAAIPDLVAAFGDGNPNVRAAVLQALVRIAPADDRVVGTVLAGLNDAAGDVDLLAARSTATVAKAAPTRAPDLLRALFAAQRRLDWYTVTPAFEPVVPFGKVAAAAPVATVGILLEALRDQNRHIRAVGALAIGDVVRAAPALAGKVEDALLALLPAPEQDVTRPALLSALQAVVVDPSFAPRLIRALFQYGRGGVVDRDILVRSRSAIPRLLSAAVSELSNARSQSRSAALSLVGTIAGASPTEAPHILPRLLSALRDQDSGVRAAAAGAILTVVDHAPSVASTAAKPLLAALNDSDPKTLASACDGLGQIVRVAPKLAPSFVDPLVSVIRDNDKNVRSAALSALIRIVDVAPGVAARLVEPFLSGLDYSDDATVFDACRGLGYLATADSALVPQLVNSILKVAANPKSERSGLLALSQLAAFAPAATFPSLTQALEKEDTALRTSVRRYLATSLAILDTARRLPSSIVSFLVTWLSDDDPTVRTQVPGVLGLMGLRAQQAIPELSRLQSDPNPMVQKAAADALASINRAVGSAQKQSPSHPSSPISHRIGKKPAAKKAAKRPTNKAAPAKHGASKI